MLRNLLRRKLCNNLEISQERLTFALTNTKIYIFLVVHMATCLRKSVVF